MAEKQTSAIKPFDPIRELDLFRSLSSSWGSFPSLLRHGHCIFARVGCGDFERRAREASN